MKNAEGDGPPAVPAPLLDRSWTPHRQAAGRKAPGPDHVTNELIVHLGDAGRQKLLELANMSWARGELPLIWRKAIIVPIPKKGKPRDSPARTPQSASSAVSAKSSKDWCSHASTGTWNVANYSIRHSQALEESAVRRTKS